MAKGGEFEYMALYWLTLYTRKRKMKRFRSGYLLRMILHLAGKKANGNLSVNAYLLFAHDITIASLLDTLGLFNKVLIFVQSEFYI